MNRRSALPLAILFAALAIFCGQPEPAPKSNGRDLVLFVIDTLRADRLGCYGYDRDTSPNIDRFAASGVRCAQVWAQSSWTAPSMVSLFLSRFVASDFKKMPETGRTLPQALQEAGYATTAFQFNILLGHESGFERGFDEYLVEPSRDEILSRLDARAGKPRFFYFHFTDPHDPYAPPPEFDVFPARAFPPQRIQEYRSYLKALEPGRPDSEIARQVKEEVAVMESECARYDGEVRAADRKFGDLLQILEEQGTLVNTVVIVAADHGECLWEHREALALVPPGDRRTLSKAFKRTHNSIVTEELLRVPLVFGGPGVPRGKVIEPLVANVDLAPTVLDLLGVAPFPGADGRSLAPDFAALASDGSGHAAAVRDHAFASSAAFSAARTASGHKVILPWATDSPDPAAYFHLPSDPQEKRPLSLESGGDSARGLESLIASLRRSGLVATSGEETIDSLTEERLRQLGYK